MKNPILKALVLLTSLTVLAPLASAKSTEVPKLQVRVETPTVFDLSRDRDIADALAVHLTDAFRRNGFDGRIAQIYTNDEATPGIPVLDVQLIDWRTRPTGLVECRVTASVTDLDGHEHRLGAFNGTAITWNARDRFTLSRSFEDAAVNAMRDLYRDFAKLDTAHADQATK